MFASNLISTGALVIGGGATLVVGGFYLINTYGKDKLLEIFKDYFNYSGVGDIWFSVEPEAKPLDSSMPTYSILSKSSSFTDYKGKFGGKYGNLLVDDTDTSSDGWWDWIFKNKDNVYLWSDSFKGVSSKEEIKSKCKEVYGKQDSEVEGIYFTNVWRFCSPLATIPHSLDSLVTKQKYIESFGKQNTSYSSHLVADRPFNKNVWLILYEKVFSLDKSSLKSGSLFAEVDKGYSSEEDKKSLNKVCDDIYTKKENDVTNHKEEIFKYCTFATFEENSVNN